MTIVAIGPQNTEHLLLYLTPYYQPLIKRKDFYLPWVSNKVMNIQNLIPNPVTTQNSQIWSDRPRKGPDKEKLQPWIENIYNLVQTLLCPTLKSD